MPHQHKSYFHRDVKLHTPEQMFKRLAEIGQKIKGSSGEPIAEVRLPDGPSVVNSQSKPSPLADPLVWLTPVRHANTEATQTSRCGRYAVFGRRSPEGFVFIARAGLESLGAPQKTAEAARAICEKHHG